MNKLIKTIAVAGVGGILYLIIELLWRGKSNMSMFVLGGICFAVLGLIHKKGVGVPVAVQALTGACVITVFEFIAGCALNLYLGLHVWSYESMPFNILGQVCLLYFVLWIVMSVICFKAYDLISGVFE